MTNNVHCTSCGRSLNGRVVVWLEFDQRTNTYHALENIPQELSQGWFPFGADCAAKAQYAALKVMP